jgi:hypothetical protein
MVFAYTYIRTDQFVLLQLNSDISVLLCLYRSILFQGLMDFVKYVVNYSH